MTTRRAFLQGLAATSGLLGLPASVLAAPHTSKRLVLVLLRGGLDGLALVPPHGDARYPAARGSLALPPPGESGGNRRFSTAASASIRRWHRCSPCGSEGSSPPCTPSDSTTADARTLDAQDLLENGTASPRGAADGWLGRAMSQVRGESFAIGSTVPLVLRGASGVSTVDPARDFGAEADFVDTVADLYSEDPLLGPALSEALACASGCRRVATAESGASHPWPKASVPSSEHRAGSPSSRPGAGTPTSARAPPSTTASAGWPTGWSGSAPPWPRCGPTP